MKQLVKLTICLLLILAAAQPSTAQKPELVAQIGHTKGPEWLEFGLDGRILVSSGEDHVIKVWDVKRAVFC